MNLPDLVRNPVFLFVTAVLGGLCGAILKGLIDVWTGEAKRRGEWLTHFSTQVEALTPSYYLMSNFAHLLSSALDNYLRFKFSLQLMLRDRDDSRSYQTFLKENIELTAAQALFAAGKLYRVITDRFWIEGGRYMVRDQWANRALVDVHNQIMMALKFDSNVLLNYIDAKTEERRFQQKLERCQKDEKLKDLRREYEKYQEWLMMQDKEVKLLAANARAYSDLFDLEMKRLYQEAWGKPRDDPRQAREVKGSSPLLSDGTRELVTRAAQTYDKRRERQDALVREIANPAMTVSNSFLNAGWTYYSNGQWDLAIEEYKRAIVENSQNAAAYNNLGNAYTQKSEFQKAEEQYLRALGLEPGNAIFNHNIGRMLSRQESRQTDALGYFEKSVGFVQTSDPNNDSFLANIQNDLGLTLAELERWDDAIDAFGRAIALQPLEPVLYANLAQTYEKKYRKAAAEDKTGMDATAFALQATVSYKMSISLCSSGSAAVYQRDLAEIYRSLSRWSDALDAAQAAVTASHEASDKAESWYQLGKIYEEKGDPDHAVEAYAQALSTGGVSNSRRASVLVEKLAQSGKAIPGDLRGKAIAEAIKAGQAAIEREPDRWELRTDLANIYYYLGDYQRFLKERDAIVRVAQGRVNNEEMAGYYNQLGLAYRKLEIVDMAFTYYQRAIQLHASPEYYRNFGLFLQAHRFYDQAREPLERARDEGKTDDYDILLGLSDVYANGSKPDFKRARQLCALAAEKRPGDPGPYMAVAGPLLKEKLFAEAADAYRKASDLATQPDERAKFLRAARDAYDEATKAQPDNLELHFRRGNMLDRLKEFNAAEAAYRRALDLSSERAVDTISVHEALGNLFYRTQSYEAASEHWETALRIADELTPAERSTFSQARFGAIDLNKITNNLGTAYDALNQKEAARARYEEVVYKQPNTAVARINLGNSRYLEGNYLGALGQFQEAFRLKHPDALSPLTLFRIGNCYFRIGQLDLAREKWKGAVELQAGFAQPLYNLGVLAAMEGNSEEAVQRWRAALQAAPEMADAQYNLAILSLRRGETEEAEKRKGQPGFESLAALIAARERGEPYDAALRDIKDR